MKSCRARRALGQRRYRHDNKQADPSPQRIDAAFLLQQSGAYTPPQFLTAASLASGLSTALVFCVLAFSLFRIVRRRSNVPFGSVVLCIVGFLLLTGLSGFEFRRIARVAVAIEVRRGSEWYRKKPLSFHPAAFC